MTIDEFDQFLARTLDRDCRLLCSMQDPPTAQQLRDLAGELGMDLPEEYVAFQRRYGAAYFEVKEEVWPRPAPFAVGPYWSFLRACIVPGIGPEVPEILDVRVQARELNQNFGGDLPERLVPVFRWEGSSDPVCVSRGGRLFLVSHETPGRPEPIEKGFLEYVAGELETLVRNKARLRTEVPQWFETEEDRMAKRRADAERDAGLTARRCPECGSPCPAYRRTCKVCGFEVGRQ